MTSKSFFLSILNVSIPDMLKTYDLSFQRANESKPFCTLITKNGKSFLRVNPWEDDGIRIIINDY
jgi:hypothetical protein